jgi:hypothetical protein
MDDSTIEFFYNLRYAVLCLGSLIGIGAGIFLMVRKRKIAGLFTIIGFLLFSIDPIMSVLIYVIFPNLLTNRGIYGSYPCISGISFILGCIALIIALIQGIRPVKNSPDNRCKSCGALLEPGVLFCEQCGRAVN